MPKLVVLSEGFTGRSCELKADKISIGRTEDNAFQITEPSVSSHHCEVFLKGKEVVVKDLNSTNGTYIDGDPVTEAVLKAGQTLRLGQVELKLENGVPAAPAAPAKKKPDGLLQTGGVKLNDLESGPHGKAGVADSAFKKKSNQINKIFVVVGLVLGLIVVVALVKAFLMTPGN